MTAVEPRLARRWLSAPAVPASSDPPVPPGWLALVPGGHPGSVAVLGPPTEAAVAALASGRAVLPGGQADAVIVTDDHPSVVRAAVDLVAPGGVIRVERSRRRRRRRSRRILRRAGMADVSTWWARPSLDDPRCLVRLEDRVAATTVVRLVADRRRRTGLESALARSGLAGALGREVSVMALAPGGAPGPALSEPADGHRVDGLVTPGYRRSRAVIGVSTDGAGRLHGVAKVARRPEDDGAVAREAALLAELRARTGAFPGAPGRARVLDRSGREVLVEDAVVGRPLDRRAVRRDPIGALVAGRRWLDSLPRSGATVPAVDGRAEALLRRPLTAVATRPGIRPEAVQAAAEILGALESVPLPVVFEHGDLSHPNLFVRDRDLVAVDWERARVDGLPLHDLVFFVAYLTESVVRPGTDDELARAVVRALRPHGWARLELDVHTERLGLDRGLVPALQVACWTRQLAARPVPTDGAVPGPGREEALWRASVEAATKRMP